MTRTFCKLHFLLPQLTRLINYLFLCTRSCQTLANNSICRHSSGSDVAQNDALQLRLYVLLAVDTLIDLCRYDDRRLLEIPLDDSSLLADCWCCKVRYVAARKMIFHQKSETRSQRAHLKSLICSWLSKTLFESLGELLADAWATTALIVALMLDVCTRSRCTRLWWRIK